MYGNAKLTKIVIQNISKGGKTCTIRQQVTL